MDALNTWAAQFVTAHPQVVSWLMIVLMVDQALKTIKNALKLNIPDNVFDGIGDAINAVLKKAQLPKQ